MKFGFLRKWSFSLLTALVTSASAATFTIPDGDVDAFISAVNQANTNAQLDVIVLATNGAYTFFSATNSSYGSTALPAIQSTVEIVGNGSTLQRSGLAQQQFRFFVVEGEGNSSGELHLRDLTLTNGIAYDGGAIYCYNGMLTVSNCVFAGNTVLFDPQEASDVMGGAIYNWAGELEILSCTFSDNYCENEAGAVFSRGDLYIENSRFINNRSAFVGGAVQIGNGDGDFNAEIVDSSFLSNSVDDVEFSFGGALAVMGDLNLSRSVFAGNSSVIGGGAFAGFFGVMQMDNCTFSGNSAGGIGGGLFLADEVDALLINLTITENSVGTPDTSEVSPFQGGGGIFVGNLQGRPYLPEMDDHEIEVRLLNCIVAGNLDVSTNEVTLPDLGTAFNATIFSIGYNLIGITNNGNFLEEIGDQLGNTATPLDPLLGPLADNGGSTLTHSLLSNSPARNAGDPAFDPVEGPKFDQRGEGFPRLAGARVDIGAFELGLLPQTITFDSLPNRTYGDGPLTVSASASSGLPVTFSVVSGPASASGPSNSVITANAAGVITIRASQPGDGTYAAAPDVDQTFTNYPALLTVTADNKTRGYGAINPPLTATFSGFVNEENVGVLEGTAQLSTTATAQSPVNGGPYPILVTNGTLSATNYVFQFVSGELTVTQATLLVLAGSKSRSYGETNPLLTVSYFGFVNEEGPHVIDVPPSVFTAANSSSPVGNYPIVVSGGSDDNYSLVHSNGNLNISPAVLVATADDKTRVYGSPNPALTISYTGFANGENESVLDSLPVAGTTATLGSSVGTYPITVTGGNDTNYVITPVNGQFEITRAPLTIVANDVSRKVGRPNPILTGSAFGLLNEDFVDAFYSTPADSTSPPGEYPIFVQVNLQNSDAQNYSISTSNGVLTVLSNLPPVLVWPNGDIHYTVNDGPVPLDLGSLVEDLDNEDFRGTMLTVDFSANGAGEDQLFISHEGDAAGQVGVAGTNVFIGGDKVASFSGGNDGFNPLTIQFDEFSGGARGTILERSQVTTVQDVQAILRKINYQNSSGSPSLLARTVRAVLTDSDGGTSAPVAKNILLSVSQEMPSISSGSITLNPQTGLYVQRITIINDGNGELPPFRVLITKLRSDVVVHNASGKTNGIPYVQYNSSLPPGGRVSLYIEYFVPSRTIFASPTFIGEFVEPAAPVNPSGTVQAITRSVRLDDGSFLVEFKTETGRIYYVQYSHDLSVWKTATPYVTGNGTQVQWVDNGPPKTESQPNGRGSRYYRVLWVTK